MKILAVDSTGLTASVAVVSDFDVIAEFSINHKKTHSQTLVPMISETLKLLELNVADMDYFACANGPGSFTGLRIGAATVKGLACATNKQIVPVPTLDALAYNVFDNDSIIIPIMDARRGQVYTAFYIWEERLIRISEYMADSFDVVAEMASTAMNAKCKKRVIFTGDGVSVFKNRIDSGVIFLSAPDTKILQRAASVGRLAVSLANEGRCVHYNDFQLFYLRKSQAERELEEKTNG